VAVGVSELRADDGSGDRLGTAALVTAARGTAGEPDDGTEVTVLVVDLQPETAATAIAADTTAVAVFTVQRLNIGLQFFVRDTSR
jgi:hypothetical protein